MPEKNDRSVLTPKDMAGSRLRCLLLTGQSRERVADTLGTLVERPAMVSPHDTWMPVGVNQPDEAKLGEAVGFLNEEQRAAVTGWWLAKTRGANTPNWDIVSTCTVSGMAGLILVEAKAHAGELHDTRLGSTNEANTAQISAAIGEANDALNDALPGEWKLTPERCYQLCNRFAWAWKVASLGVPVVLVYLGFLNAEEMGDGQIRDHQKWKDCVLQHAEGLVPPGAWGTKIDVNGTPMRALIRSVDMNFTVF